MNLKSSRSSSPSVLHPHTALRALLVALSLGLVACQKAADAPRPALAELRDSGARTDDPALVTDWLLSEMLRPGGSAKEAKKARARVDDVRVASMQGELARAIYDLSHGKLRDAAEAYFRALQQARSSEDPRAGLLAWYAAIHLQELAAQVPDFGKRHEKDIELLLSEPGQIGFRAYAVVVDLWADEAFSSAQKDVEAGIAKRLGCVESIRLAGPFGDGQASDHLIAFAAENPGPWPRTFEGTGGDRRPRTLSTERFGCDVEASEVVGGGIFYGETYLELPREEQLVLMASGATSVWVDDRLVLERDVREWGSWPRFASEVILPPGRHRVLWKVGDAQTALRVTRPDGRPLLVDSSTDASPGYDVRGPKILPDPNAIMQYITPRGVKDPKDDLTRFLAAFLANHEGQPDVATILLEPLVKDASRATGISLAMAASFVAQDPIYDESQTRELVHELEARAQKRDPGLWYPRLRLALWDAGQRGLPEAVKPLEKLVQEFPEVTTLHNTLARVYEELGWGPELERTVRRVTQQFPEDPGAIALGIELAEERGQTKLVDELLLRLRQKDPDSELFLQRALSRRDFTAALAELRRLSARRPSRRDYAARIEDVLVRSGDASRVFAQLEKAIVDEPRDVHSRLALADAKLARGDEGALSQALVSAVQAGADPSLIEDAIDLIEGITELEPYRMDGREIISAYEQAGREHPGTAVRVLDYGAVLVRSDGSSRFLEHEIVRVQSEEGIKQFAELDTQGQTLHLRVIKKDGTVLEPEQVAGKPTVTMPHLDIGDYVEQERILSRWGDGIGDEYIGPTWFFKEQNVAYARSEFVIITPRDRPLQIETENAVPEPQVEDRGFYVVHRFRMDDSPAAPVEPSSPPAREFLPRLSVGWGLSFDERMRMTSRGMISMTPVDPRITRIAQNIVRGHGKDDASRARALYHWVLGSVQEGEETDGRRVIVSRSGNRWRAFVTLCQSLDIPVRWALGESRLSSPIVGELSAAQRPLMPLLLVGEGSEAEWITISDKYAPYGTVPGPLRGEAAYLLGELEAEKVRVPSGGSEDAIAYEGEGTLRADGSAELDLRIVFRGQFAANLRNGLSQIPENQLTGIIESRMLGQELKGARLLSHQVLDADKLDMPLVIAVKVEAPQLATSTAGGLLLGPPFMPRLGGLTPLSQRATPLLISDSTGQELKLALKLPPGMRATVKQARATHPRSAFRVDDEVGQGTLLLRRELKTDAGRVPPEEYGAFQAFTRQADASLGRAIRISKN